MMLSTTSTVYTEMFWYNAVLVTEDIVPEDAQLINYMWLE